MLFWHDAMNPSPLPQVFRVESRVSYFDVDPHLRYTATAYWRTLQDAAAGHAFALGVATEQLRRQGQTWMLSRMIVEVDRAPLLGESLIVETWPSTKLRGVRAVRDFAMSTPQGETLARASSLWVIVDLSTRRPLRVPEAIVELRTDPGYAIPSFQDSLSIAAGAPRSFLAEWSDSDQNEHVNNVSYVRWAIDAHPRNFLEAHELQSIELHYLRELAVGDAVTASCQSNGPATAVTLFAPDGAPAASAALQWRPAARIEGES
jgi:medium-chain acyl-[acyl-carrier-protein] hydrolase